MLMADGEEFRTDDYAAVRKYLQRAVNDFADRRTGGQMPTADISPQRLRTWKAEFEEMGLLTVEDERLKATRFGRAVVDGWTEVDALLNRKNRQIALLGAEVANRILLAQPNASGSPPAGVPADADLRPLRAIWRAFRTLGDKLHWQDINRVLGHIHYETEIAAAVDGIRAFREAHAGKYTPENLADLGSPLTDDPRHITPWFNRAGIGGLLIPSEMDAEGFRSLGSEAVQIIDPLLEEQAPPIPTNARTERSAYISYLMEPVEQAVQPTVDPQDADLVDQVLAAVRQFGDRRIITLAGLPGTGKSRAARIVADVLSGGDDLRMKDIQFHESTSYEDFMEGFVPRADGQGFERRSKTFRVINERALDNPSKTHVLLIEELTRANVHSVLGELLTFVEHRGREFTLSLSQEQTQIARNLVILATMNPRDRSALSLDDAVLRRMHRITVPPSVKSLDSMLTGVLDSQALEALRAWYAEYISILPFGHGVFAGAKNEAELRDIWEGTVEPMLCDPLGRVLDAYQTAYDAFPFKASAPTT
jgi:hypothetical protein